MVFILKPNDDAAKVLTKVEEFLALRGLNVKASKTKLVASTNGFDFLGWNFRVQENGKFRCTPSEENFKAFQTKSNTSSITRIMVQKSRLRGLLPSSGDGETTTAIAKWMVLGSPYISYKIKRGKFSTKNAS
jgi:retron-type reverse transcriptase